MQPPMDLKRFFEKALSSDQGQLERWAHTELDSAELARLVDESVLSLTAEVDGQFAGFCVLFAPGAPYESLNYRWFSRTYDDFVYLDRIAVQMKGRTRVVPTAKIDEAPDEAEYFAKVIRPFPRDRKRRDCP